MAFKKGQSGNRKGRPQGSRDKRKTAIGEFARSILEDSDYRAKLIARIKAGQAPHMEPLLIYYGYGKPDERLKIEDNRKQTSTNIGRVPQLPLQGGDSIKE